MAVGGQNTESIPQPIPQSSNRGAPVVNNTPTATSPPSRRELASWWKKFRKTTEKQEDKSESAPGIFGVPLEESIRYANVAISLTNEQGESFIYGYVPIVVAKCGVFLKEKATDVEGIFRLSGSAKRIKDLQNIFDSPDRYGKGLVWSGYTVHDAANILRRYLNQLPEPIVPLNYYERFRDPLRSLQAQYEGSNEEKHATNNFNHDAAVAAYQRLITELPPLNRQLLLYILDLLAVFSSKSDLNRMNAANLAAIFQPGIISHPKDDMAPNEYRLSQEVLIFLIENQDNFLIGMSGTAVDEKTVKDVESGVPAARSPKSTIGRSASNASAGTDSMRKFGVRRNVSVSSHGSRDRPSPGVPSPGTPSTPTAFTSGGASTSGLARSNTLPSKRSPAIASHRFQRVTDSAGSSSPSVTNHNAVTDASPPAQDVVPTAKTEPHLQLVTQEGPGATVADASVPNVTAADGPPNIVVGTNPGLESAAGVNSVVSAPEVETQATNTGQQTSPKDRKLPALFARSPIFGASDGPIGPPRQTRKLQKKPKIPGAAIDSAQSSTQSLHADETTFHTPLMSPELASNAQSDPMATHTPVFTNTVATPVAEQSRGTPQVSTSRSGYKEDQQRSGLKPPKSPVTSIHSRGSMTDPSDFDALDEPARSERPNKTRNRWRFSSSAKKEDESPLAPPPPIGQLPGARGSNSSLGSSGPPRKSFTGDSQLTSHSGLDASQTAQASSVRLHSSNDSHDQPLHSTGDGEPEKRGGLFGRFRAKMTQSREERREREAEKDRAKSPPRGEQGRSSLTAMAQEVFAPRSRSFDLKREHQDVLPTVKERPDSRQTSAPVNAAVTIQQSPPGAQPSTASMTPATTSIPSQDASHSVPLAFRDAKTTEGRPLNQEQAASLSNDGKQ